MNIIMLGSSKLLYLCAEKIKGYYDNQRDITILDTDFSAMNNRYRDKFSIITGSKKELMAWLKECRTESVVFSINNRYLIPEDILQNPCLTFINLHHALLPAHPGRNAEAWTIYEGDEYGGVTWHYIDAGIDTGRIIKQAKVPITETTRSFDLLRACHGLILDTLSYLLPVEGIKDLPVRSQKAEADRTVHYSTQSPANGILDLSWPAEKISRFLRAFDYGGATYPMGRPAVRVNGQERVILKYRIIREEAESGPGADDEGIINICKDGLHIRLVVGDGKSV